jgi:hypothetical protein
VYRGNGVSVPKPSKLKNRVRRQLSRSTVSQGTVPQQKNDDLAVGSARPTRQGQVEAAVPTGTEPLVLALWVAVFPSDQVRAQWPRFHAQFLIRVFG